MNLLALIPALPRRAVHLGIFHSIAVPLSETSRWYLSCQASGRRRHAPSGSTTQDPFGVSGRPLTSRESSPRLHTFFASSSQITRAMTFSTSGPRCSGTDFDRLFQQRFNELDSLISSESSPEVFTFPGARGSSCAPCSTLTMPSPSTGQTLIQWLALILLVVGIIILIVHISRKMTWNKSYGATLLPRVGQQSSDGTTPTKSQDTKGEVAPSAARNVTDPSDIFSGNDSKLSLVLFYATWCGHCTALKPLFHELSTKHQDVDFKLVENEVLKKHPDADKLGIKGFPTIFAMKGKKSIGSLVGNQGMTKMDDFVKKMKVQ